MIRDLQFVSPESQGIRSEDVLEFIRLVEEHKINLHSFLMARGGKIIAEGYVSPFDKDFKHRIYSASKTYVALATGLLITEGRLSLEDRIVDYLTDYIDSDLHPWKKEITVRDCLTMRLPFGGYPQPPQDPNRWCHNLLNHATANRPAGTFCHYDHGADLLAVVIKSVTGMEFIEYMRPLFDAIGVSEEIRCIKNPEGNAWGGSGVLCTLRDFAKVGEFVLNKGQVEGKQLIDRAFMEAMTSKQACNLNANNYLPLKTGGYGYLTWITPEACAFRGMGSQSVFCFLEKDFLFVCQGDTQSNFDVHDAILYDLVKYLIYDRIGEARAEGDAYAHLQEKLQDLQPPMYGEAHSDFEGAIDGKTYLLTEGNPLGWKSFRFDFSEGTLSYENKRGLKTITFGMGALKKGKFPETHYYGNQCGTPADREFDCLAACEWMEAQALLLRIYITDTSFGQTFITFSFKGDEVGIYASKRAEFFLDDYQGVASGKLK